MKGNQIFVLSVISLAISQAAYAGVDTLPEVSTASTARAEKIVELPAVVVPGATGGSYVAKRASAGTKTDANTRNTRIYTGSSP